MSAKQTRSRSRFSYLTDAGTTLATVFSYLNGELSKTLSQREGKQRAADALLAFWKPYALQAQRANSDRIKKAAQSSVEALFRQIQSICDDFGVESPIIQPISAESFSKSEAFSISPELHSSLVTIAQHLEQTTESSQFVTAGSFPKTDRATSHPLHEDNEAIFVDDEDLLGDLD